MAALTTDRNTQRKGEGRIVAEDAQLGANKTIFDGAMVAQNAGNLEPASDSAGVVTLGVARQKMANATGAPAKVSPKASVHAGATFKFDTVAGGNAITAADIGKQCFVVDDHTVARTGGTANGIVAGIVDSIDPDGGIWVKF